MFSQASEMFDGLASHAWGSWFLHILPTLITRHFAFCFEITIIMCAKQGLILVVMGLSSVTNDSEHLFMCLSATGTPSLENVYSRHWPFSKRVVCIFVLEFWKFFLYSEYQFLSDTWLANILSHSMNCLLSLLIGIDGIGSVLWCTKVVNFGKVWFIYLSIYFFSFTVCAFGVVSKKSLPKPLSWRFSPSVFF